MNDDNIVSLTDRAIIAVKEFMLQPDVKGDGLRVAIVGGGCAGFQYNLDFTEERQNDFVIEYDGLRVYIDPMSAIHLEGSTIDYVMGLSGTGFKFNNPSAKTTCGCGSSFDA